MTANQHISNQFRVKTDDIDTLMYINRQMPKSPSLTGWGTAKLGWQDIHLYWKAQL